MFPSKGFDSVYLQTLAVLHFAVCRPLEKARARNGGEVGGGAKILYVSPIRKLQQ